MSRFIRIAFVLSAAVAVAMLVMWYQFSQALQRPVSLEADSQVFHIMPGAPFREVSNDLASQGIITHPTIFRLYARLTAQAERVQAGEYRISRGDTPEALLEKFVTGEVRLHSFTIVEGWTYRELLAALAAAPIVNSTLTYEDWPRLLESFGAEVEHPEGQFLPETYRIPRGTSDVELLRQAYVLMQSTLAKEWDLRDSSLPLSSPYEALILASIVEKETALAEERPRIAGVFVRRLQQRMRLQTDPTVIYGIGTTFDGNLTRQDLRTDTPYNTYTRNGLPPTPIALPGQAAIHAALHPVSGPELYFVATGLGDGSHKFSATKDEHDAAVAEFLKRQRAANASRNAQP